MPLRPPLALLLRLLPTVSFAAALLAANACAGTPARSASAQRPCPWVVRASREATASEAAFQNPNPLLRDPENPNYAPGPNGTVAVVKTDHEHHGHMYLENSTTGDTKELVPGFLPRWSPDGKRIACTVWKSREQGSVLSIIDVATGDVLEPKTGGGSSQYAWSPDGRTIAMIINDQSSILLRLVQIPSGKCRTLAALPTASEYTDLSWSPDSRTIVATATTEPEHLVEVSELYLVDVDGASCRLTDTPGVNESEPRWLDDGRILYEAETEDSGLGWRILTLERRHKAK
jgi:dipeptidyl aminopeptidase/acylaminoacyl peptidase